MPNIVDTTKALSIAASIAQLALELTIEVQRIANQTGQTDAEIFAEIESGIAANQTLSEEHLREYRALIANRAPIV